MLEHTLDRAEAAADRIVTVIDAKHLGTSGAGAGDLGRAAAAPGTGAD